MSVQPLLDAAGPRRAPATTPGFRTGIAPRNKGRRYPADPPTVDEIVAVMRQAGHDRHGIARKADSVGRGEKQQRAGAEIAAVGLLLADSLSHATTGRPRGSALRGRRQY
jgi:hypothetical protein